MWEPRPRQRTVSCHTSACMSAAKVWPGSFILSRHLDQPRVAASLAGWRVLDGGRDDAASHAAAKQLANAAAFLDVERAVERVFGSSSASAASAEEGPGWFVF